MVFCVFEVIMASLGAIYFGGLAAGLCACFILHGYACSFSMVASVFREN